MSHSLDFNLFTVQWQYDMKKTNEFNFLHSITHTKANKQLSVTLALFHETNATAVPETQLLEFS
jgi:hypothetical protein